METNNRFYGDPIELRKAVLKSFNKTAEEIDKDVRILKEWVKTQHHLPEIMSDHRIESLLFLSKCSIERAKEKIDMYYTIRSLIPEVFLNPKLPQIQHINDIVQLIPGTKLAENFGRIYVAKLKRPEVEYWDLDHVYASAFNIMEIRLAEDYFLADHYVLDFSGAKQRHIKCLSPLSVKRATTVLRAVLSNRIGGLHAINAFAIVDFILMLAKTCFPAKLIQRIHVHKNLESLYKYVPKKLLPKEYGGEDLSINELLELSRIKLEEYQDRFDVLDTLKVNESLRPKKLENDEILGYYGSFKKINLD